MHPDEATWQALIDVELGPSARAGLEHHLTRCSDCRRSLVELEQATDEVTGWLDMLESRPPRRGAEAIRRRVRSQSLQRRFLVAASILLAITTAAGATIHSGVLNRLLGRPAGAERTTTQWNQGVTRPQAASPSGIALSPRGSLEVLFERRQTEGAIRIVFADPPTVSIVASSSVLYTVERGRVTVSNQDASASYTITLPRTLSRVSVRVGNETVFSKRGSSIVTASTADTTAGYVIPLAP